MDPRLVRAKAKRIREISESAGYGCQHDLLGYVLNTFYNPVDVPGNPFVAGLILLGYGALVFVAGAMLLGLSPLILIWTLLKWCWRELVAMWADARDY